VGTSKITTVSPSHPHHLPIPSQASQRSWHYQPHSDTYPTLVSMSLLTLLSLSTHPAPACPYECTTFHLPSTISPSTLGPPSLAGLSPHCTLSTSNPPSLLSSSGAKTLQPCRIDFVVSSLTVVSLQASQQPIGKSLVREEKRAEEGRAYQIPTSLVPPKMVVPLPGLGITYRF